MEIKNSTEIPNKKENAGRMHGTKNYRSFFQISEAREVFERNLNIDRRVREKHMELLWQEIMLGVQKHECEYIDYKVPASLYGCFPIYDVNEIMLFLLKKLREGGYQCKVENADDKTIRIWGWSRGKEKVIEETLNPKKPRDSIRATSSYSCIPANVRPTDKCLQSSVVDNRRIFDRGPALASSSGDEIRDYPDKAGNVKITFPRKKRRAAKKSTVRINFKDVETGEMSKQIQALTEKLLNE